MQTVHKTFCRNCTHSCGMDVTVEDGRAVAVKPDRDHPITEGYFCLKASMSLELQDGGDGRLARSVKRQADGGFAEIPAATAIDEIAQKMNAILHQHGPRSVGLYFGTGGYFTSLALPLAKAWLHEVGSPNIFSSSTVDQSARWVAKMRMGFVASGRPDPEDADVLMLVGANPLISHWLPAYNPVKRLRELAKRGCKTIVVDPRRTETARMADMHVQPRPGEDVTLFAGMIRVLLENGWQDQAFCRRYIGEIEPLRQAVDAYTPGYVEQRAGVPAATLAEVTRLFSQSGRKLMVTGTGIAMVPRSNLALHMAEAFNLLCGAFRRPGDPVKSTGVLLPRSYSDRVVPPSRPWESGIRCRGVDAGQVYGEMPTGALPDEILTPGPDKIRALIVLGGNPLKALGQPEKSLRAFRELELLVSLDARMNDTAKLAHYALGVTLPLERHDISQVFDGLGWSTTPFVQYAAPIVAPPPGVIDEAFFFWDLARRMGIELEYRKVGLGAGYKDSAPGHKLGLTQPPDQEQLARWWVEGSAVDFDELLASPGGVVPEMPPQTVAAEPDSGARIELCAADVTAELAEVRAETPDLAHPYRLATRRILESLNSAYQATTATARRYQTNPAFMNPDDMTDEGLTAGDRVEIASPHGAMFGQVQPDKSVRRGMVSMAQCWGETDLALDPEQRRGSFTGRLVSLEHDVEPINRMPAQTGISVSIRKAEAAGA